MRPTDNHPSMRHTLNSREFQAAQVKVIADKVTPLRKVDHKRGETRTVWNEYLQQYVEVR